MSAGDASIGARNASLDHLLARLDVVAARVRSAVARRRAADANPDDRFRGLYVTDTDVDDLLSGGGPKLWDPSAGDLRRAVEDRADDWVASGQELRLRLMTETFGLDELDADLLLVAMAPDLDPRFERLYGYLHDDITRRRASVGLALELVGMSGASATGRGRLSSFGRLVANDLLIVDELERPLLTRSLRVPDRVSAYLVGDDAVDASLAELVTPSPTSMAPEWPALETALRREMTPIYLRESRGTSAVTAAVKALSDVGIPALVIDLARLVRAHEPAAAASAAAREAGLRRAALIATPVDALSERADIVVAALSRGSLPVILAGTGAWDPGWSRSMPLLLDVPGASGVDRSALWKAEFNGHANDDVMRSTLAFRLTPTQIVQAARSASLTASAHAREVTPGDVQSAARSQNAASLNRLARRIDPRADWLDLVLPAHVTAQLHELAARARQRDRVYGEWGLGGRASRGRGITALFAGDSGTGKTLSAEVIAGELGLDLFVIDLSTVVDKYIGETEKNLDRIFNEADRVNGVLLFDEADAIFGKRSEVRDARDRYANLEIAYLLQRMERFDGVAVLTTNLRANLDDAFMRRIDVIVDFPMPEESDRLELWRKHLPQRLPTAGDVDLPFMASRFSVSGGNIRNICLTAAFFAADAERSMQMSDLIHATEREYRKLGRLTVEDEFGPYLELAQTRSSS